jgi:HAD superfamily hydrolase (TIGR01457 family)
VKKTKGFLLDMDGVLYRGRQPIPEAMDFLRKLQEKSIPFLLLTNHSCLTANGFSKKLSRMGIQVPAAQIYSSAEATAEWLLRQQVREVHAIGEEGVTHALKKCGIRVVKEAGCVVVGLDRKLTYDHLKVACRLIAAGARFIGTNPDPSYPVEDGFAPECGAFLAAIENATGKKPLIIGKPEVSIYRFAARRLGLPLSVLTMIGDRLDTDILGAKRSGAGSILVLTGHTKRSDVRKSSIQPDWVVSGLNKIVL